MPEPWAAFLPRLQQVRGVRAIGVGGSFGASEADLLSDLDLFIAVDEPVGRAYEAAKDFDHIFAHPYPIQATSDLSYRAGYGFRRAYLYVGARPTSYFFNTESMLEPENPMRRRTTCLWGPPELITLEGDGSDESPPYIEKPLNLLACELVSSLRFARRHDALPFFHHLSRARIHLCDALRIEHNVPPYFVGRGDRDFDLQMPSTVRDDVASTFPRGLNLSEVDRTLRAFSSCLIGMSRGENELALYLSDELLSTAEMGSDS